MRINKFLISSLLIFMSVSGFSQKGSHPSSFGEILGSDNFLLGKQVLAGDLGLSVSKVSFESEGIMHEYFRTAAKFNFSINPFKDFFIRSTVLLDAGDKDVSPPWQSDFFYQIGYYNWRNKTFSFGYENYQPNKFTNGIDDLFTNFKRGSLFLSYNYVISNKGNRNFLYRDKTSQISFSPFFRIHPEYQDANNNFAGYLKPILGTNIRYTIWKNIYVETGLFYYPIQSTKLPWDPDFTYGFGIFDWRPFKLNLSYGNWIANRFPWNETKISDHGFMNGEATISFSYAW